MSRLDESSRWVGRNGIVRVQQVFEGSNKRARRNGYRGRMVVGVVFATLLAAITTAAPRAQAQGLWNFDVRLSITGAQEPAQAEVVVVCFGPNGVRGLVRFPVTSGGRRLTQNDFPAGTNGICVAAVVNADGAQVVDFETSNSPTAVEIKGDERNPFAELGVPGVKYSSQSSLSYVKVTVRFMGEVVIRREVVGPAPAFSVNEVNIICNNNGPRESFALANTDSRSFTVPGGTACLVTSVADNGVGTLTDNFVSDSSTPTDGRVVARGTEDCGPVSVLAVGRCRALVVVGAVYAAAATTTVPAPSSAVVSTTAPPSTARAVSAKRTTTTRKTTKRKTTTTRPKAKR